MAHGDGAPGTAVAALIAIVAHGEDVPFRNFERHLVRELRMELLGRELVVRESVVIRQKVRRAERGKIVAGAEAAGHTLGISVIFDRDAVDVERATLRFDGVAADRDDAFDEVLGFLVKRNEHKYIPSRGFMHVEKFDVRFRDADSVDKLADEDAISHEQVSSIGPEGIWNGSTTKGRINPKTSATATTMGRRYSHATVRLNLLCREGDSS